MLPLADYIRFAFTLFGILTPFAAIPVLLELTRGQGPERRRRIADIAALTVFCFLSVSALSGEWVLRSVGASLPAFQVAGGVVLLLMGLSMLNARLSAVQQTREEAAEAESRHAVGVVPLAMPVMAGPGSMSAAIILVKRSSDPLHIVLSLAAILAVCIAVWIILRMSDPIGRRLGITGLNVLNRIFGLLLASIAVEMVAAGLRGLFPALG